MSERRPLGRRSKKTPALIASICDALRVGATRTAASQRVGIDRETFYDWLERDPAFSGEVMRAEADAEMRYLTPIASAAQAGDWRAASFWLERRRPKDYGLKAELDADVVINVSDILRDHLVRPAERAPLPEPTVIDIPPGSTNGHV